MRTIVDKFKDTPIYFESETQIFTCQFKDKDYKSRNINELKQQLEEETIESFNGEFFVKDYNGIKKFITKRKWTDKYDGKVMVRGVEKDRYHNEKEETVEERELYPNTTHNQKMWQEGEELIEKGWELIRQGETKASFLRK